MLARYIDPSKKLLAIKAVVPHKTKSNCFTLLNMNGTNVSVGGDGMVVEESSDQDGGHLTFRISGNLATVCPDGNENEIFTFPFVIVDSLL